jgi:RNA polymerase sigma-70 factor (ECF subfamily)
VTAPFWFLPFSHGEAYGRAYTANQSADVVVPNRPLAPSDAELVARIGASDTAAFETLFRTYYKDLHRYATSLTRDAAIAEELVADTFVALWDRRTHWLVHASVRAHLFTAVRHRALHWHRRTRLEARHAVSVADALAMDVTVTAPADQVAEWSDVVRIVRAAIAALPPRTREAYVLHRQDDLTYAEVAQIMGTSAKTVEKQVASALRTLRAALAVLQG